MPEGGLRGEGRRLVGSIPFNPGSMWDRFVEVGWWGGDEGGGAGQGVRVRGGRGC